MLVDDTGSEAAAAAAAVTLLPDVGDMQWLSGLASSLTSDFNLVAAFKVFLRTLSAAGDFLESPFSRYRTTK